MKLHEIVAIEPDLKKMAEDSETEAITTFTKRDAHFDGFRKIFTPSEEGIEVLPVDEKVIAADNTVEKKLDFVLASVIKAIDASATKEMSNTTAKADIVLDGITIAANVPATVIINLENKLKRLRRLFEVIPTLDPLENWKKQIDGTYQTDSKVQERRVKYNDYVVVSPATAQHPAQIKEVTKERKVGIWESTKTSTKITPLEKSLILHKLDNTIQGLKQARERANSVDINKLEVGQLLLTYILGRPVKEIL